MSTQYSIGEFAKKTGMTIRTLHYYDEMDLLKPSFLSASGRRYYSAPKNCLSQISRVFIRKNSRIDLFDRLGFTRIAPISKAGDGTKKGTS